MKLFLSILLIALIGISCKPVEKIQYSINKDLIAEYRNNPVTNRQLIEVIQRNDEFINLSRNLAISEASLEHHLINEFSNNGITTFIVFEYFSLEGISCNIKAVTFDDNKNDLLSIVRLANYEEYPDGSLTESTFVEGDFAERTTIVKGLQGYNDSLDKLIMKIDSTIFTFILNDFKQIEVVDSVAKHYEYFH